MNEKATCVFKKESGKGWEHEDNDIETAASTSRNNFDDGLFCPLRTFSSMSNI